MNTGGCSARSFCTTARSISRLIFSLSTSSVRPLERLIGSAKFIAGYLLSGLGSSAGVVFLWVLGLTSASQLVGASGAIMGVIGISAGLLLRHRQSTLAGRQLQNILVIVAIQTAFDLWTPQVSLAAHLCGFLSGVGVGLIFASQGQRRAASWQFAKNRRSPR